MRVVVPSLCVRGAKIGLLALVLTLWLSLLTLVLHRRAPPFSQKGRGSGRQNFGETSSAAVGGGSEGSGPAFLSRPRRGEAGYIPVGAEMLHEARTPGTQILESA